MNKVASCMVDDRLKQARAIVRDACERAADIGCPAVAVCILRDEGRNVTNMGVSSCLQDDPAKESALMLNAIGRCMTLLTLHHGIDRATILAIAAIAEAARGTEELARDGGK